MYFDFGIHLGTMQTIPQHRCYHTSVFVAPGNALFYRSRKSPSVLHQPQQRVIAAHNHAHTWRVSCSSSSQPLIGKQVATSHANPPIRTRIITRVLLFMLPIALLCTAGASIAASTTSTASTSGSLIKGTCGTMDKCHPSNPRNKHITPPLHHG